MNKKNEKVENNEVKKVDTKKLSSFKKRKKLKKILLLAQPMFILLLTIQ